MTRHLQIITPDELDRAEQVLAEGGLLGLPTETVYGLAADARNDLAVARIFEAKGRPSFNPLIIHVQDQAVAAQLGAFDETADRLAAAFWPGAMTLVLPLNSGHGLSKLVSAGLDTVALRVPAHPVASNLLRAFGGPIAAPSANPSGRISPTRLEHVVEGLGDRIDAVIDAGPCGVGIESTILRPAFGRAEILREGGIPKEAIERCIGPLIQATHPDRVQAPGQMASHYAPDAAISINSTASTQGDIRIGFGLDPQAEFNLSPSGDLLEAAANLFAILHDADRAAQARGVAIHVAPVPDHGLGRAINDRLRRAAAPRD